MARATHGVSSGSWYYEVTIKPPQNGEDGHVRLGWCTEMGDVQAPVTNRYHLLLLLHCSYLFLLSPLPFATDRHH